MTKTFILINVPFPRFFPVPMIDRVKDIIGPVKAQRVEELAIDLYTKVLKSSCTMVNGRLLLMQRQEGSSSLTQNSNVERRRPGRSS
jgi:hypothetical protein